MKYEERIVCFIDILGFRGIIQNTLDTCIFDASLLYLVIY